MNQSVAQARQGPLEGTDQEGSQGGVLDEMENLIRPRELLDSGNRPGRRGEPEDEPDVEGDRSPEGQKIKKGQTSFQRKGSDPLRHDEFAAESECSQRV